MTRSKFHVIHCITVSSCLHVDNALVLWLEYLNQTVPSCLPEGEHEEAWLTEAGLATLFQESELDPDASEDSKAMLSTLTRAQAAAVEKRLELLKQTMRKRNKPSHVPDVREIFKPPPGYSVDSEETQVGRSAEKSFI